MYAELPHTGIGAATLTVVAIVMSIGGWIMTRLGRR